MKRLLAAFPMLVLLAVAGAGAEETVRHAEPSAKPSGEAEARRPTRRPAILDKFSLLFRLQDQTAAGQADSIAGQKQLLLVIGTELETFLKTASPEQVRLLAPDIAAYVLSGGNPAAAAVLAKNEALDLRNRRILEASAVFMQGDNEAAARLLKDIETRGLPARLIGRLALVQALLNNGDLKAKQTLLAVAMAAMPGSLIEESALRRSALAYAEAHDERRFWERIARYQRRFPNSLYAPSFWRDVSSAIIIWCAKETGFDLEMLDLEWKDIQASHRRNLYLELTQLAAAANVRGVTEFAAARLQRLSADGSREDQVARLYMSIYRIASPEGDDALRGLKSVRRESLGNQEQALLDAALAVGEQINRPLPAVSSSAGAEDPEEDALEARAEVVLGGTDKLLEGL